MSEKDHIQIQSEVESVILDSVTNFNAVIKVKGTKMYYMHVCMILYACRSYLCIQLTFERGRLVAK